jgi:hypothetical protein
VLVDEVKLTFSVRVWVFQMSNTWRMASAMSTPRSFIGTGLIGDCVFAIGGYDGEDYLQVCHPPYHPRIC